MPFSRPSALVERPDNDALTRDMVGIGMNFAAEPNGEAPIEETLVHASSLGMDNGDLRVLSVLTTWLGVHAPHVNADRLVRCVSEHPSARVRAYWVAVARWLGKDRRFARLAKLHDAPALDEARTTVLRGLHSAFPRAASVIATPTCFPPRPWCVGTPATATGSAWVQRGGQTSGLSSNERLS